jgi:hypothetical protein
MTSFQVQIWLQIKIFQRTISKSDLLQAPLK